MIIFCLRASDDGHPLPCTVLLLYFPSAGVGAQGGDLDEACSAALDSKGMGLLIPVSRGISRAKDPAAAAAQYRDSINLARVRAFCSRRSDPGGFCMKSCFLG